MGKSRLTLLKQITIPRLEPSAATISIHVDLMLERELDLPIEKTMFWTESTSVIRYVENENRRFHTFVANRVEIIRDRSLPSQWNHVDGKINRNIN